jgi:hypothetical protein
MVTSKAKLIDSEGNFLTFSRNYYNIKELLKIDNIIFHSSVLFKKQDIIELNKYRIFIKYSEDYDLWLRLLLNNKKIYHINEVLIEYRQRINNISNSNYKYQLFTKIALRKLYLSRKLLDSEYSKSYLDQTIKRNLEKSKNVNFDRLRSIYFSKFSKNKQKSHLLRTLYLILKFPYYAVEIKNRLNIHFLNLFFFFFSNLK